MAEDNKLVTVIDTGQKNPLHDYASHTYRLSLYMISPKRLGEGLGDVTSESNLTPDSGFYLLARSGGSKPEDRAPALQLTESIEDNPFRGLEFFIDDLSLTTAVNAKMTDDSATPASFNFKFKISEPFGTSFLMVLRDSHERILKEHPIRGSDKTDTLFLNQPYGLKIEFIGYDSAGNILPATKIPAVFYSLRLINMKHRLDGKMSQYDISAASFSYSHGLGKLSNVDTSVTAEGVTFQEWANDFAAKLNQVQQKLTAKIREDVQKQIQAGTIEKEYDLDTTEYEIDVSAFPELASSQFAQDTTKQTTARTAPMGPPGTRSSKNATDKASSAPGAKTVNRQKYTYTAPAGDTITKVLTTVAAKTVFMQLPLAAKPLVGPVQPGDTSEEEHAQKNTRKMLWMSVTPVVTVKSMDNARNSYAMKIKYVVKPYKVAYAKDPNVGKFYSPELHRRYEYYYTGKNLDVKSFELNLNATYFLTGTDKPATNPFSSGMPITTGRRAPGVNSAGDQSMAAPAQTMKKVIADFTDPSAMMNAKLTIYGDPGYLVRDPDTFNSSVDTAGVIDPMKKMVFIQMKFKVATDYNTTTGLLDVTDNLRFNKFNNSTADANGMLFMVNTVTSTFSNGSFMQDLQVIPMFNVDTETKKSAAEGME